MDRASHIDGEASDIRKRIEDHLGITRSEDHGGAKQLLWTLLYDNPLYEFGDVRVCRGFYSDEIQQFFHVIPEMCREMKLNYLGGEGLCHVLEKRGDEFKTLGGLPEVIEKTVTEPLAVFRSKASNGDIHHYHLAKVDENTYSTVITKTDGLFLTAYLSDGATGSDKSLLNDFVRLAGTDSCRVYREGDAYIQIVPAVDPEKALRLEYRESVEGVDVVCSVCNLDDVPSGEDAEIEEFKRSAKRAKSFQFKKDQDV